MLHRMRSYAGEVRWTGEASGSGSGSCDLAFHRGNGNFQAKFTEGSRVVTLLRATDGKVRAFENARARAPDSAESLRFRLVQRLADTGAIEAEQPGPEAYRVRLAGTWYRVQLESQTETRVHGQPK